MRREAAMAVGLMLGFCATSCTGGKAPSPPSPRDDCKDLARVNVTLTPGSSLCEPQAHPDKVCVHQGGVVEWKITNSCGNLESGEKPAFEIALQNAPWAFEGCVPRLERVPPNRTRLICGIPEDAPKDTYKYNVEGEKIKTLDPDIEIN
jgi:hypothetical protein